MPIKRHSNLTYLNVTCQSALTGESLPVTKSPGDGVYSGSTCKQGEIEAVVIATGVHTFFGKAAHLVDTTTHVGHFQQVRFIDLFLFFVSCLMLGKINSLKTLSCTPI